MGRSRDAALFGALFVVIGCSQPKRAQPDASVVPLCTEEPLVCGNGKIDSCLAYVAGSPGYYMTTSEPCDGPGSTTARCQDFGYSGGAIGCSPTCTLDPSHCDLCWPDPHVIDCASTPLDPPVVSAIAIAASDPTTPGDRSVGVAYLTGGDHTLSFMALSVAGPTVTPLGTSSVSTQAELVAVAPVPGGWLVAVGSSDLELLRFDENGAIVSRRTVAAVGGASANKILTMAPGAGGDVIVVWGRTDSSTTGALTATLVSETGAELVAPFAVRGDAPLGAAAVWTGSAFVIATSASTPTGFEVALVRATTTGTVTSGGRFAAFAPSLWVGWPPGGLQGRLVYNHEHVFTEGGQRPFDLGGNLLGTPGGIETDTVQALIDGAHAIQIIRPPQNWVLVQNLDGPPPSTALVFTNIDAGAVDPVGAFVGDVLVVTWIEFGHLRVARVAP